MSVYLQHFISLHFLLPLFCSTTHSLHTAHTRLFITIRKLALHERLQAARQRTAEKVESEMLLQSVEDETTLAVPTDQSVVCTMLTPPFILYKRLHHGFALFLLALKITTQTLCFTLFQTTTNVCLFQTFMMICAVSTDSTTSTHDDFYLKAPVGERVYF